MSEGDQSHWASYGLLHALACMLSNKAVQLARHSLEAAKVRDDLTETRARWREHACAAGVIVAVQASLESWINTAFFVVQMKPIGRSWIERWEKGLPEIARRRSREEVGLDPDTKRFFGELSRLRNLIVHGDLKSWTNFRKMPLGEFPPATLLHAKNSVWAIEGAERAFRLGERAAALGAPSGQWRSLLDTW